MPNDISTLYRKHRQSIAKLYLYLLLQLGMYFYHSLNIIKLDLDYYISYRYG